MAVGVPSAVVMSGGIFLPALWIRLTSLSPAVSLLTPVLLVGSWMLLAAYVTRSAPAGFDRLSKLRAGLVVFLIGGICASVVADALFRAFVNKSSFCCMQPVDAMSVVFAAVPFVLTGLPLLVRSWPITVIVLVCSLLAGSVVATEFFIDDPQHGTDGQLGSWLIRMAIAGVCVLVCAVTAVIGVAFADD